MVSIQNTEKLLASALAGESSALHQVAAEIDPDVVIGHRLAPALAIRALACGVSGPSVELWLRQLRLCTANWLRLEYHFPRIGHTLGKAEVKWIPLKGNDLGTRVYDYPEERPVGDLDILVPKRDYIRARNALEEAGWKSFVPGKLFDRFILDEFHHWSAISSAKILLELHIRLWSLIPSGLEAEIIEKSVPDPSLGPNGHRAPLAYAFVIAAVQAQINPAPRQLLKWWDLSRIGEKTSSCLIDDVIALAQKWDLQLPVALAASVAAGLWDDGKCQRIADTLSKRLRFPERLAIWWSSQRGIDAVSRKALVLARLFSFRSRRGTLRGPWRMIWSHPGLVERDTPDQWPWFKRRTFHVLHNLRLAISRSFTLSPE